MRFRWIGAAALGMLAFGCTFTRDSLGGDDVLAGRVICIDPGHGGTSATDQFRVGPSGEREEWINLRVALMLRDLLDARGAEVVMTRTEDVEVGLQARAEMARAASAEVCLSVHHNATADRGVNFPIIYFHGNASENQASVALARTLGEQLKEKMYKGDTEVSVVSDHVIFPGGGAAVLRHSYGIPGVIGEASFFTNSREEQRLKTAEHNEREAEAYIAALEEFFSEPRAPVLEKYSTGRVVSFEVYQEAERMRPEAQPWRQNFERGAALMEDGSPDALEEALELFTLSARAFPDSPVARECHWYRSQILERSGRGELAEQERKRVREFYVPLSE